MENRSLASKIIVVVGLFFIGGILLNVLLGIVGSVLWFAIKIMIPVAIIVWLVRVISGNNGRRHRNF